MRVLLMHKSNPSLEAGVMPTAELIANVGKMIGEMLEAGIFLDGTGLRQSALGVRLDFAGGKRTVTSGPFPGRNELTAGLCILRVQTLDEAVVWASRFADLVGDCQIDIRPVTEPWDLGLVPRPEGQPSRYMAVYKADRQFEAGGSPAPTVVTAIARLIADMKGAGVFQTAELLQPSSQARRLHYAGGKGTVLDGPFTESKELIAGFVMLRLDSLDAAMEWAARYAAALGDIELDIRPLREGAEFQTRTPAPRSN